MLPAEIRASDMTGSVRAGLSALLQGADAIGGGAKRALVAIGDCRLAAPEGKAEQTTGDGAVAFVLGARGRDRRNRGERLAHARVPGHLARAGRAFFAFVGRALHADAGAFSAARHGDQERAGEGESRAGRSVEGDPRRAQRPRGRRNRACAQDRSGQILRFICLDGRTDRRRARGPDARGRAAVAQSRATGYSSRRWPTAPMRFCSASRRPTPASSRCVRSAA